ncbi:MAG: lysophospholipid acyltransferase family protein [Marmoricola sp.]
MSEDCDPIKLPPPPTAAAMALADVLLAPWRAVARPTFAGVDRIPETGPVLIVGNHSTYGALDVPLVLEQVYRLRKISIRTLGDRLHDSIPGWREFLRAMGAVQASQANARALLEQGQHVLVFPGGAREVNKRRGQQYQLLWEGRLGFAKLAQSVGCPVVPLASVGADELYDIVADADSPLLKPLQDLIVRRVGRDDMLPPLGWGLGPTFIPKLQQLSFSFGDPIDAAAYGAHQVQELRDVVKTVLEDQISALRARREKPNPT